MKFDQLGLCAEILRNVLDHGYDTPTPIQAQAIPPIIEGRDIMGAAQTGTGKTASFTLPLLHKMLQKERNKQQPSLLVLVPTRELAAQVHESICTYGKGLSFRSTEIYGGVNMKKQVEKFKRGVEIIVATPGRLLDHINQKNVDLSKIEMVVFDEADRILDMGFIHDVKRIMKHLPYKRQTLLFSATFSKEIKKLIKEFLKDPVSIEIAASNTTAEKITQKVHFVDRSRKSDLLYEMIVDNKWEQVLVFTRTKHAANRLSIHLEKGGISADAIHGNKSQGARTKALAAFKNNKIRVLVATDIAARGLDIQQLPHVINFELPIVPEDYVHRIGRTGRAGMSGEAISLVCVDEHKLLRNIEKFTKMTIEKSEIEGYEPDPSIKAEPIRRGRMQPKKPQGKKPISEPDRPQFKGQKKRRKVGGVKVGGQKRKGNRPKFGNKPKRGAKRKRF